MVGLLALKQGNASGGGGGGTSDPTRLSKSANLSDLTNVATARTNLGLGSAALSATTDFDSSGSASTAQTQSELYTDAETSRATTAEGLKLAKASNLSDVANVGTARTNLGLGTAATHPATDFDSSGAASTAQAAAATYTDVETSRATSAEGLKLAKSANLSDLANAGTARTNLGLATVAATGSYTDLVNTPALASNSIAPFPSYQIACWGDSLTAGNEDSTGVTFPNVMSVSLGNRPTYNGGVGGETSTQIKNRMVAATSKANWCTIIWAGRNNYSSGTTVLADVATMVAALGTNANFLILSVLNGESATEYSGGAGYNQIAAINASLAATYPSNYSDIRAYLVSQYNSGIPQDVIDHGHDIPPSSLRFDGIHPNAAGYTLVAGQIATFVGTLDSRNTQLISEKNVPAILQSALPIHVTGPAAGLYTKRLLQVTSSSDSAAFQGTTPSSVLIETTGEIGQTAGIDFGDKSRSTLPVARIASRTTNAGSFLQIGTTDFWASGVDNTAITVDPSGKVGVSNAAPTTALDVTGTVTATAFVGSGSGLTGVDLAGTSAAETSRATAAEALLLVKASNLSDVANAGTARTNLGLGTAAVKDVGVAAFNVVALDSAAKVPAVDVSQVTNLPLVVPVDKTANFTVLASQNGNTFYNTGASAEVDLTLPSAVAGLNYNAIVSAAQILKFIAGGSDTITWAGVTTTGVHVYANQVGANIRIGCIEATKWIVFGTPLGDWSIG